LKEKCEALKTENAEMATELRGAVEPIPWPHAIPAAEVVRIANAIEVRYGWPPTWLARDVTREWGGWWVYGDTNKPVFDTGYWSALGNCLEVNIDVDLPRADVAPANSLISVVAAREWVAHSGETAEDERAEFVLLNALIAILDEVANDANPATIERIARRALAKRAFVGNEADAIELDAAWRKAK